MVSVEEATGIIFSHLYKPQKEAIAIVEAAGRVLAESIKADRDLPPFNRVTMDGIAIAFEAWQNGQHDFVIDDLQPAGTSPRKLKEWNHAIEVMTGAVLPEGTDTVIRYEDIKRSDTIATVGVPDIQKGQNIHVQGSDAPAQSVLLEPGLVLSSAEVALLASIGKSKVEVYSFPKAAVISSGDELIPIDGEPEPYQVRRSNAYALQSAMRQMSWEANAFHLPDQREAIIESLMTIKDSHDLLILSGGVSKGKFDFIPEALHAVGIEKQFHEVQQRPGKPLWFGVSKEGKVAFALPGNPVSTYLGFYRYIKPWVLRSFGLPGQSTQALLAEEFTIDIKLTYFLQVNVKVENGKLMAYPLAGGGSGDFVNLKNVTGFLELPPGKNRFEAGKLFPYIPFRDIQ
jgi:molybdopterin molybdotransferase